MPVGASLGSVKLPENDPNSSGCIDVWLTCCPRAFVIATSYESAVDGREYSASSSARITAFHCTVSPGR